MSKLAILCGLLALWVLGGCSEKPAPPTPSAAETPVGTLYESHTFSNCPTIRIYMKGWQDASFDAFIDGPNGEKLFARNLPDLKSQFQSITNKITIPQHAKLIPARLGDRMYDVYWSDDLQRVGIAFKGNWVVASNLSNRVGFKLRSGDSPGASAGFHQGMEKFMAQ